jgi:hypothetical protein
MGKNTKFIYTRIKSTGTTVYVPSSEWDTPTPSPASECAPPEPKGGGGGAHTPAVEGVGESQFRRLEKKLRTLPTLWVKTNYATNLMQVQNVRVETREVQNILGKSGQCQLKGHHLKRGRVVVSTCTPIKSQK